MTKRLQLAIVVAGMSLSALATASDWRAELRIALQPPSGLTDEMDERGVLFLEWIGDTLVDIEWDDGSVEMALNNATINDVEQWWEATSPEVLAFSACTGGGTLGPEGDAGLLGWFYLDDFGGLRMELEVDDTYVRWVMPLEGEPAAFASICRCRTIPLAKHGCTNANCNNTDECPMSAGHYCEWTQAQVSTFATALEALTE